MNKTSIFQRKTSTDSAYSVVLIFTHSKIKGRKVYQIEAPVPANPASGNFLEIWLRQISSWIWQIPVLLPYIQLITGKTKKLSYCWETVRRESMPRIAEMDVEMTT